MVGLNEKDMGAVIRTYDLKDYYYPTLFPLKETNFLTWKMLEAQSGLKIAADHDRITARFKKRHHLDFPFLYHCQLSHLRFECNYNQKQWCFGVRAFLC